MLRDGKTSVIKLRKSGPLSRRPSFREVNIAESHAASIGTSSFFTIDLR
jgi:hypothetical protein